MINQNFEKLMVGSPVLKSQATFSSALKALMLRELLTRFGSFRFSWVFVLLDPIINIAFIGVLFGLVIGSKLPGADFLYFVTIGILCWELVIGSMNRGLAAIPANAGLFSYRQIRPVTVILARVLIEYGILIVSVLLIWAGFTWIGHPVFPHSPLQVLLVLFAMSVLGLGLALTVGILNPFFPMLERVIPFITRPLFFSSSIFFSLNSIPSAYRGYLCWNPILNGIELVRGGVFYNYDTSSVSLYYLLLIAFLMLFIGFVVNAVYGHRVVGE